MQIKNHDFRFLVLINLIFLTLLYIDFLLPSETKSEEFKSFYNVVNRKPNWKSKATKEIKYILECESGENYYLVKFPQDFEKIEKGTKITIEQTPILKKLKVIQLGRKNYEITFLSLSIVIYIFVFCLIINIANVFFTNTFLDFMLAFSTVLIYVIGLVYIFSY